jgi:hypothetical protein
MRVRPGAAAVLCAVAIGACGATPPQAPLHYAQRLDVATSGISTACGEAYEVDAFPGDHSRALRPLERSAEASARKLAGVARRNGGWIYQGETVRQIVGAAESMLGACRLRAARALLERRTRR